MIKNKIKFYLCILLSSFAISIGMFTKYSYDKYKSMKAEISAYRNNQRAYEDIISNKENENMVLRLNRDDLRNSNDSLVQYIQKQRKSLKTPQNKPGDVDAGIETGLHATDTVFISNPCDFKLDTVVDYNNLTKSHIKIKKDSLISSIDVNNIETLHVYTRREYVNSYKNGWQRFWHFDWAKEDVQRYDITNSNNLIKVLDKRVIITRE